MQNSVCGQVELIFSLLLFFCFNTHLISNVVQLLLCHFTSWCPFCVAVLCWKCVYLSFSWNIYQLKLTLKVLNFWKFTSYCSLKPLWSGMGEVVPARTLPTLHPPSPQIVHQLARLALVRVNHLLKGLWIFVANHKYITTKSIVSLHFLILCMLECLYLCVCITHVRSTEPLGF